jgi:hypothetical protein
MPCGLLVHGMLVLRHTDFKLRRYKERFGGSPVIGIRRFFQVHLRNLGLRSRQRILSKPATTG